MSTCQHVNISPCLWSQLVSEVPVGLWIWDKFKLKIDQSVKTPWQEYGIVAGSWFHVMSQVTTIQINAECIMYRSKAVPTTQFLYNTCRSFLVCTIPYHNITYNTIQYNAMQCNAIQCNAMQCNAMQYNTMQCNVMQYNTIQQSTWITYYIASVKLQISRYRVRHMRKECPYR